MMPGTSVIVSACEQRKTRVLLNNLHRHDKTFGVVAGYHKRMALVQGKYFPQTLSMI